MAIVTISGQVGSGAQEIGREIATRLNCGCVDRELLVEAARKTGANVEELEQWETHPASLAQRIARFVKKVMAQSAVEYPDESYQWWDFSQTYAEMGKPSNSYDEKLTDRRFLEVTTAVIKDLATLPSVVIVGRGAPYILKDYPQAVHVLTVAPHEQRIERIEHR